MNYLSTSAGVVGKNSRQLPGTGDRIAHSMTDIPIIDISPLRKSSASGDLKKCVKQLHEALHEVGFFYINGHGVPTKTQRSIEKLAKAFFAKPLEFKNAIAMEKAGLAWRGYFPVGGELTSGKPDRKEGVYFGRELPEDHPAVKQRLPLHGANLWPAGEQFSGFPEAIQTYMKLLSELGHHLMKGVALGLGISEDYFRQRFTEEPTTLFRLFNYPRHTWEEAEDEWGVREHTDMGFLTLLKQDDSGGLQVKLKSGKWASAPPIEDTFVVNIGDMLEVWTKGIYRATPHRVKNRGEGDRLSLPFFFDPAWKASLEPIDSEILPSHLLEGVEPSRKRRWDGLNLGKLTADITYGEFVWDKVRTVFPHLAASTDQ